MQKNTQGRTLAAVLLASALLPFSAGAAGFEVYEENLPPENAAERIAAPASARTAELVAETRRKSVPAGALVRVKLWIESGKLPVNAVEAELRYSSELLTLIAIDNTDSDLSMFLELEEAAPGAVKISALQPFPGVSGRSRVADLLFRARQPGTAAISFVSAAVLANDGFGTDVLGGTRGVSFKIP